MTKQATKWIFSLFVTVGLVGCTSNLTYQATQPSSSLIEEIASAAGVDAALLKQSMTAFIENGGLRQVSTPEQFPILACVADSYHDGVLNLSDVAVFASHFGKTCVQVAEEAQNDPEMDDNISCPNLFRDSEHVIDMEDLDTFIELYRAQPEFNTNLCNDTEAEDNDGLSTYTEAFAWLNTDPLDPETYGMPDYEYYQDIVDPSDSNFDCGNGEIDEGEECDGSDLGTQTCQDQGYSGGGTLGCLQNCTFYFGNCEQEYSPIEISSVFSSALVHGQSYSVQGSGFGVKSPVEPYLYDNFEVGNEHLGEVVSGPNWHTYSAYDGELPVYTAENPRVPGHIATKQGPGGNSTLKATNFPNGCGGGELYVSGWFHGEQVGGPHSMKFIQANGGEWGQSPSFRSGGQITSSGGHYYWSDVYGCGGENLMGGNGNGLGTHPFTETWNRWEWHGEFTSNGVWQTFRDQELRAEGNADFSLSGGCCVRSIYMASYYGRAAPWSPPGSYAWWNWDEIYIDTTQARVEICDHPVKASASRCEVQIPHTTWNDGTVRFTANRGAFTASDSTYLIVVDKDGRAATGVSVSLQ